jgi:hypothetical protein
LESLNIDLKCTNIESWSCSITHLSQNIVKNAMSHICHCSLGHWQKNCSWAISPKRSPFACNLEMFLGDKTMNKFWQPDNFEGPLTMSMLVFKSHSHMPIYLPVHKPLQTHITTCIVHWLCKKKVIMLQQEPLSSEVFIKILFWRPHPYNSTLE